MFAVLFKSFAICERELQGYINDSDELESIILDSGNPNNQQLH